jgi:DUF971 family protein
MARARIIQKPRHRPLKKRAEKKGIKDMAEESAAQIWPIEIRCSENRDQLSIQFDNGDAFTLSAELLRVESPSAEVQGHAAAQKKTPRNKNDVTITEMIPVGNYAVRLIFSDGHDTGIFSWALLHDYGKNAKKLMADYHQRVAEGAAE